MSFSEEWEEQYRDQKQLSIWPWSDLVSLVYRYTDIKNSRLNVLELGVGAGANIPFFLNFKNINYFAIEGSPSIVEILKKNFPMVSNNLVAADFTKEIPFEEKFDLIIDRSSLTHNSSEAIGNCFSLLKNKVTDKGMYIAVDWFSDKHSDMKHGASHPNDPFLKNQFTQGQFKDVGDVHFFNKEHLLDILKDMDILFLEHKIRERVISGKNQGSQFASWDFVANFHK